MTIGTLTFHSAFNSGVFISELGSGTYDHIAMYGPNGSTSAVEIDTFQDTTFIADSAGNVLDQLSLAGGIGSSGQLMNNKWISTSGVNISGVEKLITEINTFKAQALNTYPDFPHRTSGTLLIRYFASGTSQVNTFNAQLYAYDATGALTDPPPDVQVFMYGINASGQFNAGSSSGKWTNTAGQGTPLLFVDHSNANNWEPKNEHIFVAGISVKPESVGTLDDFNYAFSLLFA